MPLRQARARSIQCSHSTDDRLHRRITGDRSTGSACYACTPCTANQQVGPVAVVSTSNAQRLAVASLSSLIQGGFRLIIQYAVRPTSWSCKRDSHAQSLTVTSLSSLTQGPEVDPWASHRAGITNRGEFVTHQASLSFNLNFSVEY
jgi:hypothetical protein